MEEEPSPDELYQHPARKKRQLCKQNKVNESQIVIVNAYIDDRLGENEPRVVVAGLEDLPHRRVGVEAYTPGGVLIWAQVTHIDDNQTLVTFDTPQTGYAIIDY